MLNFSEYEPKVALPDWRAIKKAIWDEFDNERLTVAERKAKEPEIHKKVREAQNKAEQPYNEEKKRLEQLFWTHCREDLGYADWLTDDGISKLENKAYDRGHAYGFSSIYSELQLLVEFLDEIRPHVNSGIGVQ